MSLGSGVRQSTMPNRKGGKGIFRLSGFVLGAAVLICGLSASPAAGDEKPTLQALVVTTGGLVLRRCDLTALRAKERPLRMDFHGREDSRRCGPKRPRLGKRHPYGSSGRRATKKGGRREGPGGHLQDRSRLRLCARRSAPLGPTPLPADDGKQQVRRRSRFAGLQPHGRGGKRPKGLEQRGRDETERRAVSPGNRDRAQHGSRGAGRRFLHLPPYLGEAIHRGTSGCTAVSAADMEKILRRLKPEANPVLIQLPQQEYERMRGPRGLP